MKRYIVILTLLLLFTTSLTTHAEGKNPIEGTIPSKLTIHNLVDGKQEEITVSSIIYLSDGGKLVTTEIKEQSNPKAGGRIDGSRERLYLNSDNVVLWKVTLFASFTYNGSSSSCISASSRTDVYQGNWSESSNNTYASGNTAIASVTVVRKFLFIVVETQNVYLTMSCTPNGYLY